MNQPLNISIFNHKRDAAPKEKTITWRDFAARIRQPFIREEKDGTAFAPCRFQPPRRLKDNVRELSMLVFDVDAEIELESLRDKMRLLDSAAAIYSTHSHRRATDKNPNAETRWRVCIPLAEAVAASEFENLWQTINRTLKLGADENARDVSRLHYSPCKADQTAAYDFAVEPGDDFFGWRDFLAQHSTPNAEAENNQKSANQNEQSERRGSAAFEFHEDRNDELQRIIAGRGRRTRTGFQMKCPAHNGAGVSSLFSAFNSPAVTCRKGCKYFDILRAFGLPDESLPSRERQNQNSAGQNTQGQSQLAPLRTVNLANVKAEKISWLWKPFIAFGAFTIIDGEEGIGKSLLTLAVGCAVACGKGVDTIEGFEMTEAAPANVLLLSAEESLSFVVKPRLLAMYAPCERFTAIDEPFTFNRDGFLRLEMAIAEFAPALVIIDPLFSYTGETKLNDDNSIRLVTGELIRIAEKYNCAIVGVRHIGKSKGFGEARAAGLNGVGWRASARSALLVGKDPNTGELAVCQNKNNLAPKSQKSFGFKIETTVVEIETGEQIEVGKFFWTGESQLTERQMLSTAKDDETRAEQSEAVAFLQEILREGARPAKDVKREAVSIGLSEQNLRTARAKLNVVVRKTADTFDSSQHFWTWALPAKDVNKPPEDVGANTNQHHRQNNTKNTPYGNDLAEDVDTSENQHLSEENQHLRQPESDTEREVFEL